jgi:3-dehydroquinate synthase
MLYLLLLLLLPTTSSFFTPAPSLIHTPTLRAHTTVTVPLPDSRNYPIYIGSNILQDDKATLLSHVKGRDVLIITNDLIAPLYLQQVSDLFASDPKIRVNTCVLPDGEEHKNLNVLKLIYDKALECNLDRQSTFVALGGGVIGDMVGYAAASYQRGVNFIQIPTSVMAMVDSSVGGKTGVNHELGKNMIGAFWQPQCVFVDVNTLNTLPDRELKSGISEIVKYGCIRDRNFFEWLEGNVGKLLLRDEAVFTEAIKRSCENKASVVAADEKEAGVRATLNLGHTFGHAIENGEGYGTYLHGEAVAIGTAMSVSMSEKMGWITPELKERVVALLKKAGLPVTLPKDSVMTPETFMRLMAVDKKVSNGVLRLILLKGELGECVFTSDYEQSAMQETVDEFCEGIKGKQ